MRILITGSAGNLGRPLVARLRAAGHAVYGIDLAHSEAENYMRCDIRSLSHLAAAFVEAKPDVCVNLAGEFGRINGVHHFEDMWTTNVVGTRNVIEMCKVFGVRLVHASSSEAYGSERIVGEYPDWCGDRTEGDNPMRESDLPYRWHNEYALSKFVNEKQLEISSLGDKAVALRIFNVYGEERYTPYRSVVCQFLYRLLHKQPITVYQNMSRDFLFISDFVDTTEAIITADKWPERVYNVGGNESVTMKELTDKCIYLTGASAEGHDWRELEPQNVVNKKPDLTLIKRDFGHEPKVGLDEGLKRTIAWMRRMYGLDQNPR